MDEREKDTQRVESYKQSETDKERERGDLRMEKLKEGKKQAENEHKKETKK